MSRRGHFGIGVYRPKTKENIGSLMRSAHAFGAAYAFTIGRRYERQASDVTKAYRHMPLWHFTDFADFQRSRPMGSLLVGIECPGDKPLRDFDHPHAACYLLGSEDHGLPAEVLAARQKVVTICGAKYCLNVANAGTVVLYDRVSKGVTP